MCSWGTPGKKFYEGTPTADPWVQALHVRSLNEKESKYLLGIVEENKQNELKKFKDDERPDWMTQNSRTNSAAGSAGPRQSAAIPTARNSNVSASSSQLNGAISELKGFNSSLKDELMELKGYLAQTNERLMTLERSESQRSGTQRTGRTRSTARSQSTLGSSTGRTRSTARSDVSSVIEDARAAIAKSRSSSRAA